MKLGTCIGSIVLGTALTFINPVQAEADNSSMKIQDVLKKSSHTTIKINPIEQRLSFYDEVDPEIKQELKSLNKIDFKNGLFPKGINFKQGEIVYVLFPIKGNNAGILCHGIPYERNEMKNFEVFMTSLSQGGYFPILIAKDYEKIPKNVEGSFVEI